MPHNTNPYHSTVTLPDNNHEPLTVVHRARLLWRLAYLYPLFVLCAFYGTWLCAWSGLGHMPRPNLDDPSSIDGITRIVHHVPAILIMAMPVLSPLGFAASFFLPHNRNRGWKAATQCMLALLYLAVCMIALKILWADPGRVVEWYFD
ncbi:hypothetical protein NZK35_15275 [Stieleria sp. ICT_E10.1]|uniref:hypothetical protein n=1 Tax=Stieleria sedimenti TaxID=2976331 RepID=UPI002180532D|nr:hypothetical protein [Stieleria sedimenti]MCS7468014.1 hypothetical protein [Stieleria sedimenti]